MEGAAVQAVEGDTLASALIDSGFLGFRQSNAEDMRGVFCGMGVCNECALTVDGVPGRLGCLTNVEDGMDVTPQPVRTTGAEVEELPEEEVLSDLLVIGAGPGGLTAAKRAAELGAEVVVIDERHKLGGQFFKQPAEDRDIDLNQIDRQFSLGRSLIEKVTQLGVRTILGARVWGAFSANELYASSEIGRYVLRPQRLIVSTGAFERGLPVPGWTLPGVMTTGAAQTLIRSQQVSPGKRVLVAGNGPLNLQVASELTDSGVEVAALVEVADLRWHRNLWTGFRAGLVAPGLVGRGIKYRANLSARGVPVHDRAILTKCIGDEAVTRAVVTPLGPDGSLRHEGGFELDVDAVCMGYGFTPSVEITRSLGCRHRVDPTWGTLEVVADDNGRTTVPGVWVIGDARAVNGAHVAMSQAVLAVDDALAGLGGPAGRRRRTRSRLARHKSFQELVWGMYSGRLFTHELADETTIICRCESISLAEIVSAVDDGAHMSGAVKRLSRAGMGKCQGRYCEPVISRLVAQAVGAEINELSGFAPRPPARPVPIRHIARSTVDDVTQERREEVDQRIQR